jgi:proline iminopeptidase
LRGVFTLRRWELDWFYNGPAGAMAPAAWEGFCQPLRQAGLEPLEWVADRTRPVGAEPGASPRDNIASYHDLLWAEDPATAEAAALAWTVWETRVSGLAVSAEEVAATAADAHAALAFARLENHYFVQAGFFTEGQLIRRAGRLRGIPCVIVQGAHDLCCPPRTAHDLAAAYPGAELRVVLAGHSAFEPAIVDALVQATDRCAASETSHTEQRAIL